MERAAEKEKSNVDKEMENEKRSQNKLMCLFHKQFSSRSNVCLGDVVGHLGPMTKLIKTTSIQTFFPLDLIELDNSTIIDCAESNKIFFRRSKAYHI